MSFAPNRNIIEYPSQDELFFNFVYMDGALYWLYQNEIGHKKDMNNPVGSICSKQGHKQIYFNKKQYLVHRLIWIYHYGDIPDEMYVDHIDGDANNNKIENLRLATHKQNLNNIKRIRKNNTSGIPGVSWNKTDKRWRANIKKYSGKPTNRNFVNKWEAYEWWLCEMRKYRGDFYNEIPLSDDLQKEYEKYILDKQSQTSFKLAA